MAHSDEPRLFNENRHCHQHESEGIQQLVRIEGTWTEESVSSGNTDWSHKVCLYQELKTGWMEVTGKTTGEAYIDSCTPNDTRMRKSW
jgi:hypothetical protein